MEVKICSGAPILATNSYKRNPGTPIGNEIDLQQGDVLSYIMVHEDNEHWWLAEYSKGEVVYVPVSYLMMIVDRAWDRRGHTEKADGSEDMFRSADPGNELVQEEPGHSNRE